MSDAPPPPYDPPPPSSEPPPPPPPPSTPPPAPPGGGGYGAAPPPPPPPGPAYGAPAQGYGQPGYAPAPGSAWTGPPLAEWPKRAGGLLIDSIAGFIAVYIVSAILGAISDVLGLLVLLLGYLAALGFALYNAYLAGETGQSIGMKQMGIRLVRESDGQPVGGGLGIARYFVHFVDGLPCIPLGYLWPLWDPKKQTFTDKIFSHVVIDEGTR